MEKKTILKEKVMIDGAKKGVWTMDYDAALQKAKKENVPVFINFTGSDWCHWCILMKNKVFIKKEWKEFAEKNLYLVYIDFPSQKSLVPDKYVKRNRKLLQKFGVKGYPTFLVYDSDGKSFLGKLGASREVTPEKFIDDVKTLLYQSSQNVKKLSKSKKMKYYDLKKKLDVVLTDLNNWLKTGPANTPANLKKYNDFLIKKKELENQMKQIFVKRVK
jgi:protein disulfide-isomerase